MKIYRISQNKPSIEISVDGYIESLRERLQEIADFTYEHYQYLQTFQFSLEDSLNLLKSAGYQDVETVRQALQLKDRDKIHDAIMSVFDWYKSNRETVQWGYISKAIRDIQDFDETLGDYKPQFSYDDIEGKVKELGQSTIQNMQKISDMVVSAIEVIPQWNGSAIRIKALTLDSDNEIAPEDSATIEMLGGSYPASFSFFSLDGKFQIDDVLEAGDDDFFEDGGIQSDYFNLIQALRNPDAFKRSRTLTLYTARPKNDRALYLEAKQVPGNIFLTSSFDFAEGFALEYGGNRDIWKVRIKEMYLTKTMDSPDQRQYQVTGGSFVPVESIELLS